MVINMSELFTVDGTVKTYEVPLEMSEVSVRSIRL